MTDRAALVDDLVDRLREPASPRPLVVVGAHGTGKSSVLSAVTRRWPGTVWATAGRHETARPSLAPLVRRWAAELPTLRSAHRGALSAVLGSSPAETTAVVEAVAALAGRAGGAQPVLWCVDDLDRTDALTCAVVDGVVTATDAVRVLASARSASTSWHPIALPPLSDREVGELLTEQHDVAPEVAAAVAPVAEGNPSVAGDLVVGLSRAQRDGSDAVPWPLPIGDDLQARAGDLLAGLDGRQAAAVAAVAVRVQVAGDRWVAADTVAADDVRSVLPPDLVHVEHERIALTPRWLAAGVLAVLPPAALAGAHRESAARTTGEESLRHRALAAHDVDEGLAQQLVAAADRRTAAAELAEALTLLEHAHAVAPARRRPEVAGTIATTSLLVGRPGAAHRWSAIAEHDRGELGGGPIDHTAVHAAASLEPDPQRLRSTLRETVAAAASAPVARRVPLAVQLVVWGQTYALPGVLDDVADAESLLPGADEGEAAVIAVTAAIARRLVAGDPACRPLLEAVTPRVRSLLAAGPDSPDIADATSAPTVAAQWLGVVAMSDERWQDADDLLADAARLEESRGWSVLHAATTAWRAELCWRSGRWAQAEELLHPHERDHAGTSVARALRRAVLDRGTALRSVEPPPLGEAPSDEASLAPSGIAGLLRHHGLALAAAGAGRADLAVSHLRHAERIAGRTLHHPGLVWWQGDLVEALAADGNLEAADEALLRLERHAADLDTPLVRAQVLRARASRQQGRTATRLLDRALALLAECPVPFEVARTRLALAEAADADDPVGHARAAHELFVALGAAGFAARAAAVISHDGRPAAWAALTDRGREITARVGRGETNRQIASALHLSEKTVEFHLAKVYRTLQVSGRTELAARHAALGNPLVDFGPEPHHA
jgi:DNA-binding CsgD family transcriptional regulator